MNGSTHLGPLALLVASLLLSGQSLALHFFDLQDDCAHENVGDDICCIGFDEDYCEGWRYEIKEGYQKLPWLRRNDIESLVCRRGCMIELYNHDGTTASERGEKFVLDATGSRRHKYKTLRGDSELREMASAVNCSCPLKGPGYGDAAIEAAVGSVTTSNGGPQCRAVRFHGDVGCKLFDAADCQVDNWDAEINLVDGESRSFSLLQSLRNNRYRNAVRSVGVAKGCKLELYPDSDFTGELVGVAALDQDVFVTLATNKDAQKMDQDTKSVKCFC